VSFRHAAIAAVAVIMAVAVTTVAHTAPAAITFFGVVPDDDYKNADTKLKALLSQAIGSEINYQKPGDYSQEIHELVGWRSGAYIARMTPYAYVTAAMLGAHFDVLATYRSQATNDTTYHSYFVVNRRAFGERPRNLDALRDYLRREAADPERPRFIYHDVFSTSSFFLPALWLRNQLIFEMPSRITPLAAIELIEKKGSSTDLVIEVAQGRAEIAAVWDGTKKKFDAGGSRQADGDNVLFIPLPEELPNDLLVSSIGLDPAIRQRIVTLLSTRPEIGTGDFKSWVPIGDAPNANHALSALRQLAAAPPASVVVRVDAPTEDIGEAARKALRLSSPEFVAFDPNFHADFDVDWTLKTIHDGVELTSSFNNQHLKGLDQHFPISYVDARSDLTTRIVALIHSRMHRVRYVWPYDDQAPTILGDVDFKLEAGAEIKVQRIEWKGDPDKNDFSFGQPFSAAVSQSDFYWFKLKPDAFQLNDFHNPLKNVAYRAVLVRPTYSSAIARTGMLTLLTLLVAAAAGAGWDLRRRPSPRTAPQSTPSLHQECTALARGSHRRWQRPLNDLDVLWCDKTSIEEVIEDLKIKGLVPIEIGGKSRTEARTSWGARLTLFKGLATLGHEQLLYRELVIDPTKVPQTVRLSTLLRLLVDKECLSAFAGRPLEWDGLRRLFVGVVAATGHDATSGGALNAADELVIGLSSKHFGEVIEDGIENLSLFGVSWSLVKSDSQTVARATQVLEGPLEVGRERVRITRLQLEFTVPQGARLSGAAQVFWLLGHILSAGVATNEQGDPSLCLRFGPVAILGDAAPGAFDIKD
jgi:ABC-type phosphate/phosphonate transport system substrate-binding protein